MAHATLIWQVASLFFTVTMLFSFCPIIDYNLGYTWYLGAQALFLVLFNWMQECSQAPFPPQPTSTTQPDSTPSLFEYRMAPRPHPLPLAPPSH